MVEVAKCGLPQRKWAALEQSAQEPPGAISALILMTSMALATSYPEAAACSSENWFSKQLVTGIPGIQLYGNEILNSTIVIYKGVNALKSYFWRTF